jgi:hybrid cluster-associated redox disulfide protein
MPNSTQLASMTVDTVLARWPQCADIFNDYNMACVGCPVAPYYTISEVAKVYNLPVDEIVTVLEQAIAEAETQ